MRRKESRKKKKKEFTCLTLQSKNRVYVLNVAKNQKKKNKK